MLLLSLLTTVLTYSSRIHAAGTLQQCAISLTAFVNKGPGAARVAWTHFREDNTRWPPLEGRRDREEWIPYHLADLSRALGREINASDAYTTTIAVLRDPDASPRALNATLGVLKRLPFLHHADEIMERLRAHPNLDTPSSALTVATNPAFGLNREGMAALVLGVLKSERRPDVGDGDVPYSARAAHYICDLETEGRLATDDFFNAYHVMVANDLLTPRALRTLVGEFRIWAQGRYVYNRPLPPREWTNVLLSRIRARAVDLGIDDPRMDRNLTDIDRLLRL